LQQGEGHLTEISSLPLSKTAGGLGETSETDNGTADPHGHTIAGEKRNAYEFEESEIVAQKSRQNEMRKWGDAASLGHSNGW